jgi:hypothetical protein
VDLQDARSGQTIAVQMLPPCTLEEAAERAAGFAARQVFHDDPSTPCWAVGSRNGEDLSAYMLSRQICSAGPTLDDLKKRRERQERVLQQAIAHNPAPGLAGYELAAMYDMDGEQVESLLLHLSNRAHYPLFWDGRYRLAVSLSTLAWSSTVPPVWDEKNTADNAPLWKPPREWAEITWRLDQGGLLKGLAPAEAASLRRPWNERPVTVRMALLHVAQREFRACWKAAGTAHILWDAFWRREVRASRLQLLRGDWRSLHPRRRRLALHIAIKIAQQRCNLLAHPANRVELNPAVTSLEDAQQEIWDQLQVYRDQSELDRKVPWQALFNAACLLAVSTSGEPISENVEKAIKLLRLAIENPACDLEYPSAWIDTDPDLSLLHENEGFSNFVAELEENDFPSKAGQVSDDEKPGARPQATLRYLRDETTTTEHRIFASVSTDKTSP